MNMSNEALALVGSFSDSGAVNQVLVRAHEHFHLIAPATSCPRLPAGCEVTFAMIPIFPVETYATEGGKRGLSRAALVRLSSAAGVVWDKSERIRDPEEPLDPLYVHWRMVGGWRDFSADVKPLVGDAVIDLRESVGSETLNTMAQAKAKRNEDTGVIYATAEEVGRLTLLKKRAKIVQLAQTGAKLRAIRDIPGLTRPYDLEELRKPFLVGTLRYVGTGSKDDTAAIRDSFLKARSSLYGTSTARAASPPLSPSTTTPDGEVIEGAEIEEEEIIVCESCGASGDNADVREVRDWQGHAIRACKAPKCQEYAHRNAKRPEIPKTDGQTKASTQEPTRSVVTMRFGRAKGQSISDASLAELEWYANQINLSIASPEKAKWRRQNEAHLADVTEEIARRQNRTDPLPNDADNDYGSDDDIPF